MKCLKIIWLVLVLLLLQLPASSAERLVVGSKPFTENRLLAELFAALIEARTPLKVERQFNLGATGICFEALRKGAIDLYPEYTGTALGAILHEPLTLAPEVAFARVSTLFASRYDLRWLPPLGFNNTYALVMRSAQAKALGITSISDLLGHSALRLGFTHEFMARDDGWPGLKRAYGLTQSNVINLEHGIAYTALVNGQIDVMEAYSTDGKLRRYPLKLLRDDRGFFPPYQAAAVVRGQTLRKHPELEALLGELSGKLDDATMQDLNYQVEEAGQTLEQVASAFLARHGLARANAPAAAVTEGLAEFFWSQRQQLGLRIREHLWLSGMAVGLACLIGMPLGLLITRSTLTARYVLAGAGLLQTLPSLALLALLVPFLGTGFVPALLVLSLYALLPVLRNTYTGLCEVPAELKDVGTGLGLTPFQRLIRIELPLASRVILAGVRTATVITIGTATLAAFIGAGGLGDPIITGLTLKNLNWIMLGVLPSAALALLADALLALLERWLSRKRV
ncbi:MAG: ABC transporter permease [Candidatus Melainabacteria bacterium HGW-Melainabacteria-1]|nr:MAG: ABC transporter permease [Candidatus Melainabacteria bacterium HGW-Melainabacteria-1]